jgi:uncharacterized delta-60 repeat protein
MKKLYVLLAAAFFMFITGCGGSDEAPLSSEKTITAFSITDPVATGVIVEATHTIAVTVPYNTDLNALKATFTTTGASVKIGSTVQESGKTVNDFTNSTINPLIYTVTAADASPQDYKVTVTKSPRSGSLDPDFGTSGMVTTTIGSGDSHALALGIDDDGKIVVAGYSYNGSNYDFALARYNTNGTLDLTFGTGGKVTTDFGTSDDFALALGIDDDGKIVVAGYSYNGSKYYFALARYDANGSLDTTGFGTDGKVTTSIGIGDSYAYALGIQPSDGKIVVAGSSYNDSSKKYDFALVRYNTDGSLDSHPVTGFGADHSGIVTTPIENGSISKYASLGIQSDDKIVVAGSSYYSDSNKYKFALVRYNTDGSLDSHPVTGFGADHSGIVITSIRNGWDQAHALAIQPSDGKIVVAGSSSTPDNKDYDFALVRYNTDGSLDSHPVTGFGADHSGIVTTSIGIVTTTPGSGFDSAYALGIQSDGNILAAGYSNNGSNYDFALVRYDANGSPDTTFGTFSNGIVTTPIGSYDDVALALGIQPVTSDFRIVAAGYSYNGSNDDFALVRYLPSEETP